MIKTDDFGNPIFDENEIIEILYTGDIEKCHDVICSPSNDVKLFNKISNKKLKEYEPINISKEEFDKSLQNFWLMPETYKNFDIYSFLKQKCKTNEELNRFELEYKEFEKRDLINLLRYMVYLVDVMKENGVIWGVGRGSSVASFILYLIGIHMINPIKYKLDFNEFMK